MEGLNIRLLHDHVIARRDPAPEQIGSIVVPESAQASTDQKAQTAVVLAVGPGKRLDNPFKLSPYADDLGSYTIQYPMAVQPGDRIAFSRYTGGDVPGHPGCIIMRESDVLAVIE